MQKIEGNVSRNYAYFLEQNKQTPGQRYLTQCIEFTRHFIKMQVKFEHFYKKQFFKACADGNVKLVMCCLTMGLNVELATKNKYTPLLVASSHGQAEVVKLLLLWGADIHARQKNRLDSLELARARMHENVEKILEEHLNKYYSDESEEIFDGTNSEELEEMDEHEDSEISDGSSEEYEEASEHEDSESILEENFQKHYSHESQEMSDGSSEEYEEATE